ncbi:MAG: FMN-binding negative transcriptional regulator [Planctomycetota bacterium]|nr:MAG: FMN-binding negative transcriptional regulator [Planctomycetota bacterium]
MYVPVAFAEHDREKLIAFIRAHSFAVLVSTIDNEPFATHLPLLVDERVEPHGHLLGHVARANPHAQALDGQDALAVFHGPHAYVSPRWYESDGMVPTWNYVAVHVYGRCEVVDEATTVEILSETVARHESAMPAPWSMDSSEDRFRKLAAGVVGFRLAISRIEGKWKLGQNHPAEVRQRAATHLANCADASSRAIARLMTAVLGGDPPGQ